MQPANAQSVLGNFGGATVEHFGVTSRFFTKDGKYFASTEGPDGTLHDYEVRYTFGVSPLQQYLIEFPGGRIQALGLAWDARPKAQGGQRWFHLYPGERLKPDDPLHWTGLQQNWNFMCARCHSTNLRRNYDAAAARFTTTWSEINVACEACHGAGSRHVEWARKSSGWRAVNADKGLLVLLQDRSSAKWMRDQGAVTAHRVPPRITHAEVETCGLCHTRAAAISERVRPGEALLQTQIPALLDRDLYYADGQIQGEVYEYGSFLQSKMYRAGVTCTDCHEPHSLKLRAQGNGLCLQCHSAEKFDATQHHFHPMQSAGAQCVNCHMPTTTFMVVDPRRDHSLRVPRPDLSVTLGTPNACSHCHVGRTPQWAATQIEQWYGPTRKGFQTYAPALDAARKDRLDAEALLARVARDLDAPGIARATALSEWTRFGATPPMAEAVAVSLRDPDPLVRRTAIEGASLADPAERVRLLAPMLKDPVLGVRIETARALASVPRNLLSSEQQITLDRALEEYLAAQRLNADRPESQLNLGLIYADLHRPAEAEQAFRQALRLDSHFAPAYVNLADLYRALGRDGEAETTLREGLRKEPRNATLQHALGLTLVRLKRQPEALELFRQAAEAQGDNARYGYVYAVALHSTGKVQEAIRWLERTHDRHLADREVLLALVQFLRDRGDRAKAIAYAEKLAALSPWDARAQELVKELKK